MQLQPAYIKQLFFMIWDGELHRITAGFNVLHIKIILNIIFNIKITGKKVSKIWFSAIKSSVASSNLFTDFENLFPFVHKST